MFIEIKKANKQYGSGETAVKALDNVDLSIEKGKIYVILGPSGSGKSTLMNMLGGIDTLTSGSITVDGRNISSANKKELTQYRQEDVGFVFQFYNLIADLTVQENVEVVSDISEHPLNIDEVLTALDIAPYRKRFPKELSGGQQQRVAIARALIKNPKLLLCDELTGALDTKSSRSVLTFIEKINKQFGTTIVIITHNTSIADMADYVVSIKDGKIDQLKENKEKIPASELAL
ncbi:MAG: ABC transporter ATP-binding protein [Ruminococcus sp.]|jgi:putative ABC transport system ATP-binding protein|nr:ABC transporter ATP-binding protein [Ruminococcus sp.]CDE33395.1 aBC transporter ATP-binding protein [Ruminococcus sp. CAG:403]